MLIPKASHLVERVAERLLRSGALDRSATHLLRRSADEPDADNPSADPGRQEEAAHDPVTRAPSAGATPAPRSSLFASPPAPPRSIPPASVRLTSSPAEVQLPPSPDVPVAGADASSSGAGSSHGGNASPRDGAAPGPPALASPALPDQPSGLVQTIGPFSGVDSPGDFLSPLPPPGQRPGLADPAAGMLQGRASVDAVALERAGMVDWSGTRTRISEEFRLVQRQIIRAAFGPGSEPGFSNLLLVTSARPGEGKSFMSTNLAGSIARQGDNHVLLIDADFKARFDLLQPRTGPNARTARSGGQPETGSGAPDREDADRALVDPAGWPGARTQR